MSHRRRRAGRVGTLLLLLAPACAFSALPSFGERPAAGPWQLRAQVEAERHAMRLVARRDIRAALDQVEVDWRRAAA